MPPNSETDRKVEQFFHDVETMSETIEKLLENARSSELDFTRTRSELVALCDNVKTLSQLLRDGNGQPSVLTRLASLEAKIAQLEKNLDKSIDRQEETDKTARFSITSEINTAASGKWQLRVALISGVLSVVAIVVTNVLHYILK